jgi:hypothetical protein
LALLLKIPKAVLDQFAQGPVMAEPIQGMAIAPKRTLI